MTSRRARGSLSRDEIGVVALLLVDELGDAALTMRSLAKRLQCDPMTLYRYVDSRDDLLTLVAATLVKSIAVPDSSLDDRRWLRQLSTGIRSTLCDHRNVMPIIGYALVPIGLESEVIQTLAHRLAVNSATGHGLVDRYNAFIGGVLGYLALELAAPATGPIQRSFTEGVQLPKPIRALRGKAFGFRNPEDPALLPSGFQLLTESLINAVLDPVPPSR